MPKRIYVGNLPFDTTEREVKEMFSKFGTVTDVDLESYHGSGQRVMKAVVTMNSGAEAALRNLRDKSIKGLRITLKKE